MCLALAGRVNFFLERLATPEGEKCLSWVWTCGASITVLVALSKWPFPFRSKCVRPLAVPTDADALRLPIVVPVVLYNGAEPWVEATSMRELYDVDDELLAALQAHVVSFEFLLDDLPTHEDHGLVVHRRRAADRHAVGPGRAVVGAAGEDPRLAAIGVGLEAIGHETGFERGTAPRPVRRQEGGRLADVGEASVHGVVVEFVAVDAYDRRRGE